MTPIKIYTNGFYDYSGEFKTFDNSFESAADAIVYVLDYYMNNEECMSDWSPANTLLKYSYVDGMFRDFEFENGIYLDPVKQIEYEEEQEYTEMEW